MKYKIMLACMGGFSTSMLVKRMRSAAEAQNVDAEIDAVAETELTKYSDLDIILLGPQVSHLLEGLQAQFSIPVVVIESADYGMMNGEKVLNDALQVLQNK